MTRATVDLSSVNVPEIAHPIAFCAFAENYDPHETGYVTVCADGKGMSLRWTGVKEEQWSGTWGELRELLEAFREHGKEMRREQAAREAMRAQIALGHEMADDVERQRFASGNVRVIR